MIINDNQQCTPRSWSSLPATVLVRIFLELPLQDLCSCTMVCQHFYTVAQTDSIWKTLLHQHFRCNTPVPPATSCKHTLAQLTTSTLWSCGSHWSFMQQGPADLGSSSSSNGTTALHRIWSRHHSVLPSFSSTPCSLPEQFAVAAVTAGKDFLVLLSTAGEVIDGRTLIAACDISQTASQSEATATSDQAVAGDSAQQPLNGLTLDDALEQQQQQHPGVFTFTSPWTPAGARIANISAGLGHVLGVTTNGAVWGWGSNESGQLGLGVNNISWVSGPVNVTAVMDGAWKCPSDVIRSAVCGAHHSVLLAAAAAAADGGGNGHSGYSLYTAGLNTSGQCAQNMEYKTCPAFCKPSVDDIIAVDVACGAATTVVATVTGRVLVCGESSAGQCGLSHLKSGCCHELVDVGPEPAWHGLTRPKAAQVAAVGGNARDALAKVVHVACGGGTCYAVTGGGELFAWGAGSRGQLGRGGCSRVQSTPAKLPWAKQITRVTASIDGAFAAAVDSSGHLYTWGAGKWGQLGHGDTSKRTVGRAVKQLKHLNVLQAVCGSESLAVLTCYRTSAHARPQQGSITGTAAAAAAAAGDVKLHSSVRLDGSSSILSVSSSSSGTPRHSSSSVSAVLERTNDDVVDNDALSDMSSADWVDVHGHGPFQCLKPQSKATHKKSKGIGAPVQAGTDKADVPRTAQDASSNTSSQSKLQRTASSTSSGSSISSSSVMQGAPPVGCHGKMNKGFKRLLKRLLKQFVMDPQQRDITFPAALSAADRYHIHVAAESWGLGHKSHNEDSGERVIKVWKVSRARRRMQSGGDADFDSH